MTEQMLSGGVIEWSDPPASSSALPHTEVGNWQIVSAQLKDNRGRWAVLIKNAERSTSTSVQARINRGATRNWAPRGAFEAVQRRMPDGLIWLFARYIGPPSKPQSDAS